MMKRKQIVLLILIVFMGTGGIAGAASLVSTGLAPTTNMTVLLNNNAGEVPLNSLATRKMAVIVPKGKVFEPFAETVQRYAKVDRFYLPGDSAAATQLDESAKLYNTLIFGLSKDQINDPDLLRFIQAQALGKSVILMLAGPDETLKAFDKARFPILLAPGTDRKSMQNAAMSVFGGLACQAKLPRRISAAYTAGAGDVTLQTRLQYASEEPLSFNKKLLTDSVDAIMADAIAGRAAPGGVVMVVKDGQVIFEKAYGHHTYEKSQPTRLADIFDMASITKIAATTPVIMRLTERGVINLDSTMGHYLWQAKSTNKAGTKLRDVMLHEAGFIPYIPFYRDLDPTELRADSSAEFSVKVADGCYIRTGYYQEVMWPIMLRSKLNPTGRYVYSDISMYVMKEVAEHQTGIPMQEYVQQEFYRPLGMQTAGYNPRERFTKDRIVPTEHDQVFRKTLLEGYVHDQGAAMAGGIAGHAGLFASANDLAIYAQLLLNRGVYGGERYFEAGTVDRFTSRQSATSRRGLGFDRKELDPNSRYPSGFVSDATFGHTGYTGTCLWVDPETRLTYIFLSNRVHPDVSEQLGNLAIRRRILDAIYMSIK